MSKHLCDKISNNLKACHFYVRYPDLNAAKQYKPAWKSGQVIEFVGDLYTYNNENINVILDSPTITLYIYPVNDQWFVGDLESGVIIKVFDGELPKACCLIETLKDMGSIIRWTATKEYRDLCEDMRKLVAIEKGTL